jgi:hypothetical protein
LTRRQFPPFPCRMTPACPTAKPSLVVGSLQTPSNETSVTPSRSTPNVGTRTVVPTTVISEVDRSVPALAVTRAVPAPTPCTAPAAETVAIDGALLSHRRVTPETAPPVASRAVPVSGSVDPIGIHAVAGTTSTAVTPGGVGSTGEPGSSLQAATPPSSASTSRAATVATRAATVATRTVAPPTARRRASVRFTSSTGIPPALCRSRTPPKLPIFTGRRRGTHTSSWITNR